MRPSRFALLVAVVLNVAAFAYYWPTAPDPLVSKFDASGVPDGYSSKAAFFALWAMLAALFPAIGVGFAMAKGSLKDENISIPYKALWLAPEQREATIVAFSDMMLWLMSVISYFMTLGMVATLRANARAHVMLDLSPLVYVSVLMVGVCGVMLPYFVHWSSPPTR